MEWLANLKIEYVIIISVVLLILRLWLGRYKNVTAKSAAEIVESVLIAIVLVFLIIRPFIIQAFFIPSGSMEPTLLVHDHILVNKFIYRFKEPQRGDIIVFKAPENATTDGVERDYIKRLIGLPGDVIEVRNGILYRNGKPVREPYIKEPMDYEMPPFKVPKGMLFVMGDNRNDSNDSHRWGPLDRNRVLGKALVIFWPPSRIGIPR
ncbi:MAG: signal peptidase I [Armatimonadetes bacterium]|nr:signal peptidase I [Armatimonadota bacterium]